MKKKSTQEFWSQEKFLHKKIFKNYGEYRDKLGPMSAEEVDLIRDTIKDLNIKNKRVLDIGGGEGYFLSFFYDKSNEKNLLDFSESKMKIAREKLKIDHTHLKDFLEDDISDLGKFDVISFFDVIEHIHPLEVEKFISRAKSLLKKGGRIIISTPNLTSFQNRIRLLIGVTPMFYAWDKTHITPFSKKSLDNQMKSLGFKNEKLLTTRMILPLHYGLRKVFFVKVPLRMNFGEHIVGVWRNEK